MKVSELRDQLAKMPGEMSVYATSGQGIRSARHRFEINLIGKVDQRCELATYFEEHGPVLNDLRLERQGFTDLDALLEAHKADRELMLEVTELLRSYEISHIVKAAKFPSDDPARADTLAKAARNREMADRIDKRLET